MKLEINKNKVWKALKYMKVKEHPTKNEWVNQEIKRKIKKKYMEANENENMAV